MFIGTITSNKSLNLANNPFGGTTSPASPSISSPRRPIGTYQTYILEGRYERLKELGRGTSGVVHLCRRVSDGKLFAVKEMRYQTKKAIPATPTLRQSDFESKSFFSETIANTTQGNDVATTVATRRSLISEGTLLSKIPKHKSIVHLEEIGEECIEIDPQQYQGDCSSSAQQQDDKPSEVIYQQSIYLVMEYAAGGTLRDWVYPLHLLQEREDRRERRTSHQIESTGDCTLLIPSCSVIDLNALSLRKELITLHEASSTSVTTPMYVSPNRSTIRLSTLTTELSDDGLFGGIDGKDEKLSTIRSNLIQSQREFSSSTAPDPMRTSNVPLQRLSVNYSPTKEDQSVDEWHHPTDSISTNAMSPASPMSPQSADKYFPESTLIEWFTQLATAVEFLHSKGIAHRDIKLANILVVEEDNEDNGQNNASCPAPEKRIVCKLCDFGVAATVTSGAIGTLGAVSLTDQSFLTNYMRPGSAQMARLRLRELPDEKDILFSPRVPLLSPREYSVSACGSPVIWITGNQDPNSPRARRMSRQNRNFAQTPLEEAMASPIGTRVSNVAHATFDDNTVGTPQYMAPEICDGRPHSLQCDVWSLGVSFYEICARRLPFDATNMLALMHKVIENPAKPLPSVYSPRLSAIILSMLAKDPRQRPTMKQVVQMLYYYQKLKKALDKSEQRAKEDPTNTIFKEENEFATSAFLDCTQMGVKDFVLPQQPTNPRTLAQMLSDHSSISTFTKSPTETLGP